MISGSPNQILNHLSLGSAREFDGSNNIAWVAAYEDDSSGLHSPTFAVTSATFLSLIGRGPPIVTLSPSTTARRGPTEPGTELAGNDASYGTTAQEPPSFGCLHVLPHPMMSAKSLVEAEQKLGGPGSRIGESPILQHEIQHGVVAIRAKRCNGTVSSDRVRESHELCWKASDESNRASELGSPSELPHHRVCVYKLSEGVGSASHRGAPGKTVQQEPRR